MKLTQAQVETFWQAVFAHYDAAGRHALPWRQPEVNGRFDPYKILVSELMLQQTQVPRVISKYQEFLARFPTVTALADAPLSDVLIAWQGLGYNRRAKFLWQAAQYVVNECRGVWPQTVEGLVRLPGVGKNTAGAIMAYAFNQASVFIETNVRTVYFHHFFHDRHDITDRELEPLIAQTLDTVKPRLFYWGLMDYGSFLKQQGHGKISRSKHYTKQSKFEGSVRQLRGAVLRQLSSGPQSETELLASLSDDRADKVLAALQAEGLISRTGQMYRLA